MNDKKRMMIKTIKHNVKKIGECLNELDNRSFGYEYESMEEVFIRLSPKSSVHFRKMSRNFNTLLDILEEELIE